MDVDLRAFRYNLEQIKGIVGDGVTVMPVIKAEGYGTHINRLNDVINQFDVVAVALVSEAVNLRVHGFEKDIFVLNQPGCDEIEDVARYDIVVGVSDVNYVEKLGNIGKMVRVHIEIDSGMGRTGVQPAELVKFIEKIKMHNNIVVEGIYTHLSSADFDKEYTEKQFRKFDECVEIAKDLLGDLKYVHASASNGILNYPEHKYNLVRAGIIMYGYPPFDEAYEKIKLRPVCRLRSKITFLKEVDEGTSISYARRFIAPRKTRVATVPMGYADGVRRKMIDGGEVVIHGQKAPVIGSVCMDSFMVDVTDIDGVCLGDDVFIWDNDVITLEEVADRCDTINYEIMSQISERVPRVFIEE